MSLIRRYHSIENIFTDENLRNKCFPPPPTTATTETLEDKEDSPDTYEEWLQRIRDAREIFLNLPELSEVIRDGEAINLHGFNRAAYRDEFNRERDQLDERDGVDANVEERWDIVMDSTWFDKKEEKKEELDRLKRRFGISARWKESLTVSWVELLGEEEEDIYEEVFDEDEVSSEEGFFERYKEPEGVSEMDERAADLWLREHGDRSVE